ncbi:MAG TPA: hypothetical protein VHB79_03760 [Polyangiaceae bacterium]|nr:hypothetical protein [Polyangiaceae bacterium]
MLVFGGTLGCSDDGQQGVPFGAGGGSPGSAGGGGMGVAGTTSSTSGTAGNGGATGLGGSSAGSSSTAGSSTAGTSSGGGATGGATGGDGGSASGGGGSGGTGAAVGCSAKVCQDFEKDLDATWALRPSGAFTAKIDTDQFHSGSRSLHIVAPNKTNSAWLTIQSDKFPAADFWGRAWYRITGPKGGHQEYIIAPASGNELRILNRKTDSENMGVNTQSPDKWYLTNTPVPQATWFCYEFHVTATATTVYPNGKEATEVKPPGVTGVKSLSFGWQRWQTGGGDGEMWIDDIAIGDKQIGCE